MSQSLTLADIKSFLKSSSDATRLFEYNVFVYLNTENVIEVHVANSSRGHKFSKFNTWCKELTLIDCYYFSGNNAANRFWDYILKSNTKGCVMGQKFINACCFTVITIKM